MNRAKAPATQAPTNITLSLASLGEALERGLTRSALFANPNRLTFAQITDRMRQEGYAFGDPKKSPANRRSGWTDWIVPVAHAGVAFELLFSVPEDAY